jgi:hypothetical protein
MTVSEWIEQYKIQSDNRFPTFKKAFELFKEREGKNIVETGCVRLHNDWGAGMSTYLFGEYAKLFGAKIWTDDISQANMNCCIDVTKEFSDNITYVVDDSLHFLREFPETIDFLYLDSMDCPLVDDPNDLTVLQSQNHQLSEMQLALPKMNEKGIVLLDDNQFINGGKPKLTKMFLKSEGWTELLGGQQSLWSKV